MDFDNNQFEKDVQQTIKTLADLDKGLDLQNAVKGFGDLDNASKKVTLSSISEGLETLTSKFSVMSIAGIAAITNLTNTVVNKAKTIAKALTIDPIKSGLDEYETKMNAITTILTNTKSKGTTLDDVNASLADLNTYADQTIYNFAEMTRNIGTFTAAGITLEASTSAIKGIANLAAGSGSTAAQASTAMYQLSQAMAAGSVKLMDWNSVVNAGMGGELFQNALKETARAMGVVVDESVPFRESLSSGWITSDILTRTLSGFSMNQDLIDAATQVKTITQLMSVMEESVQSGWSVSWEKIIGDKGQAVELLTGISEGFNDLVGPGAEARNTMLEYWNALGGRRAIINALTNSFNSLMNIINPIKEAFATIFPPLTGQKLLVFSRNLEALTEKFKVTDEAAKQIKNIFTGLFAIFGIGKQAIVGIYNAFKELFSSFTGFDLGILDFFEKIGFFFTGLNKYAKDTDLFTFSLLGVKDALSSFFINVGEGSVIAYTKLKEFFSGLVTFVTGINIEDSDIFKALSTRIDSLMETSEGAKATVEGSFGKISDVLSKAKITIGKILTSVGEVLTSIKDQFGNPFGDADGQGLDNIFKAGIFAGLVIIFKKLTKFTSSVTGVLDGVKESLEAYQTSLKAKSLLAIAGAIAILTGSLVVLSMLDTEKLGAGLAIMSILFLELFGASGALTAITKNGSIVSAATAAITLIAVSIAMALLAKSAAKLAAIDSDKISGATKGLGALMVAISVAAIPLSNVDGDILKASIGIIAFAFGISQLAKAVTKMSELGPLKMAQGLIGVGVVLGGLVAFMKVGKIEKMGISGGLGMTALAKGIMILGEAVVIFGLMRLDVLIQGLISVGALLLALGVFARLASSNTSMLTTALGVAILGKSLQTFIPIIMMFSTIPFEVMKDGLMALGASLVVLGIGMQFMPKDMLFKSVGLIAMAYALQLLTANIKAMGEMNPDTLLQGLLTLGILFGGLVLAGYALTPVLPVLVGVTAILGLLAVSMTLAGLGAVNFAAGLLALTTIGAVGLASITAVITGIVLLIPVVAKAFAEGIIAFGTAIAEGLPAIIDSFKVIFTGILGFIKEQTPIAARTFLEMVLEIMHVIEETQDAIIQTGMNLIINFLQGIAERAQAVTEAGVAVLLALIDGVSEMLPQIIDSGVRLIINFINGMAWALEANGPELIDAFVNLFWALIEVIKDVFNLFGVDLDQIFTDITEAVLYIFTEWGPNVIKTVKETISGAIESVTGFVGDFKEAGENIVAGLLGGITDGAMDVINGVKDIGSGALTALKDVLGIHSPSKAMEWIGEMVGLGMEEGISSSTDGVTKVTAMLGGDIEDEMRSMKLGDTGLDVGESVGDSVASGIKTSTPRATSAAKTMAKSVYEETVAWIDERKYYNELSLADELKAWQDLQAKYAEGSEESKKIAKEEYRVKNALKKAEYDHSMDWIDDRLYYGKLSLTEELAAWERVQARYEKGTDERKKSDREIFRLKNELVAKQTQIDDDYYANTERINKNLISDIQDVNKAYDDAVESRANSIYTSFSLFDGVDPAEQVQGSELTTNLNEQIQALGDWKIAMNQLSNRGVDAELIDEFEQMGPSALAELQALARMTSPELDKYTMLWQTKHEFARVQATSELTQLKNDTAVKIKELNNTAEKELAVVTETWNTSMGELRGISNEALDDLNEGWEKKIGIISTDTEAEFKDLQTNIKALDWEGLGNNIIDGMAKGVKSSTDLLIDSVKNAALESLKAAKNALGIKSPSREFAKLGAYMSEGMAIGVTDSSNLVVNSTEDMGIRATSVLEDVLSRIGEAIDSDMSMSPVIRPVIDLDEVRKGSDQISGMFNSNAAVIGTSTRLASSVTTDKASQNSPVDKLAAMVKSLAKVNSEGKTVHNQVTVESLVVREEADIQKVSRELYNLQVKNNRGLGYV